MKKIILLCMLLVTRLSAQSVSMLYAEGFNVNASTTTWVDICQIAAGSFTASKKYLIICNAQVSTNSSANEVRIRLVSGTTPTVFTDASLAYELTASVQVNSVGYFTVFDQPGTAEAITLQISSSSTNTSTAVLGQIFAMKLSDDFTEDTDWWYEEQLTDYTTTSALSATDATESASESFTANGTTTYWILGNYVLTPSIATANYLTSLFNDIDATDIVLQDIEGEDITNETRSHLITYAETPADATYNWQMRFAHETTTPHVIKSSRIFVLRLNKFDQNAFTFASAEEQPAASPSWTTTRTLAPNPNVTGDWFVFGYFNNDPNLVTNSTNTRMQINPSGGGLADNPAKSVSTPLQDLWDDTDVNPYQIFKMVSLSSGAGRTINFDIQAQAGTTQRMQDRLLVAFSAKLPNGGVTTRRIKKSINW